MSSQPPMSDLLETLEQEFTEAFGIKPYEPMPGYSSQAEDLADLDLEVEDIETLIDESFFEEELAAEYQAHVKELIQRLEQALKLVRQLKQLKANEQVRSRIADLQHLIAQISALLTQLSTF